MMVRYVSNAGLVLKQDGISIGVDCLSKDVNELYHDTSFNIEQELMREIENGSLHALIFTHEHSDHFDAEMVKKACLQNPALKVFGGKSVIHLLQQESTAEEQLIEIMDLNKIEIGAMQIQFLQTIHEGAEYADVENFTLLINKEGKHFVVTGDAAPTNELFERISAWSREIDCLFAPFPYVGLNSTRRLLCKHLNIKKIFAYHLPRPEKDVQGWIANTKRVCKQAKDGLPMPIFPEKLEDWHCL